MFSTLFITLAVLTPPDQAAVRAEVEATLARMQAAALAGDSAAYLANIATDDANFLKEQQNWAADLAEHKPIEFTLSIAPPDDAHPADFGPDSAHFILTIRYRAPTGHAAIEGGKTAECPVVFAKADPDGPGPEIARWLYRGEDWQVLIPDAPGFVVKYLPGAEAVARDVAEAFPVARTHVDEHFRIAGTPPQQIKLYSNMEHLKAWVVLSMPDEVLGGWNEPGESIKFMATYTRGVPKWTSAFAHEYGHVATWEYGPAVKTTPWWVQEGVAELSAEHFLPGFFERRDQEMRRRAAGGGLAAWDQIADYYTSPAPLKFLAYHQGYHMVRFITSTWGDEARIAWVRAMSTGDTLDAATRRVLNLSFEDLDRTWRASLKPPEAEPPTAEPPKADQPIAEPPK